MSFVKKLDDKVEFNAIKTNIKTITTLKKHEQQVYNVWFNHFHGIGELVPPSKGPLQWVGDNAAKVEKYIRDTYVEPKYKTSSMRNHLEGLANILLAIDRDKFKEVVRPMFNFTLTIQQRIDKTKEDSLLSEMDLANFVSYEELVKRRDEMEAEWMKMPNDRKLNIYHIVLAVNTYVPPLRLDWSHMNIYPPLMKDGKMIKKRVDPSTLPPSPEDLENYLWEEKEGQWAIVLNMDKIEAKRKSRDLPRQIMRLNDDLGGDDFDARLSDLALKSVGITVDLLSDAEHAKLAAQARATKEELSDALVVDLAFEAGGVHRHAAISRDAFAAATTDLIDRTLDAATRGLRDAKLKVADIAGVVLVGGATRMPQVRAAVERYFGKPPLIDLDPDRVVALGAAMQANALAGNRAADGDEWLLLDVIPLSLGVETMGGLAEKIIARNSTIPVARAQEFTTFKDGQTAMAIHVVQGERELVSDCRSLARFELRGIPPMTAGAARIRVTYQVDADGLLSVSARELTSNVEAHIAVKPSYGLGDEEVARMLQDSFGSADSDMRARALREQQVEAQRIVAATESALAIDAALLDDAQVARIRCHIDAVRKVGDGSDHNAIKDAIDALAHGTERFAELRMDASVRRALAGKRLDEIA